MSYSENPSNLVSLIDQALGSDTASPFLDSAAEQQLTPEQVQIQTDAGSMSPAAFNAKYGEGSYARMLEGINMASQHIRDASLGRETSLLS